MPVRPAPTDRRLRCPACGRLVQLSPGDLRRYGRRPWLASCGRAMDLVVGAWRVSPADGTDRAPGPAAA